MRLFFTLIFISFLVGCTTSPQKPEVPAELPPITVTPEPSKPEAPTPPQIPAQPWYPLKGWHADYDQVIMGSMTGRLLTVPSSRMAPFCPKWGSMPTEDRKKFYADFLFALAKYESDYQSNLMYLETTMDTDPVTGKQVVSEGLLQLSYQDELWAKCALNFKEDKEVFLSDWKKKGSKQSWEGTPGRTILDPLVNLRCGVMIMDFRLGLTNEINKAQDFLTLMRGRKTMTGWKGGYWAVLRTQEAGIKNLMKQRGSKCW